MATTKTKKAPVKKATTKKTVAKKTVAKKATSSFDWNNIAENIRKNAELIVQTFKQMQKGLHKK